MKFVCAEVERDVVDRPVIHSNYWKVDAESASDAAAVFTEKYYATERIGVLRRAPPVQILVVTFVGEAFVFPMHIIHHDGHMRAVPMKWEEKLEADQDFPEAWGILNG